MSSTPTSGMVTGSGRSCGPCGHSRCHGPTAGARSSSDGAVCPPYSGWRSPSRCISRRVIWRWLRFLSGRWSRCRVRPPPPGGQGRHRAGAGYPRFCLGPRPPGDLPAVGVDNEALQSTPLARGYGLRALGGWLLSGRMFDYGRAPVVSILVATGVVSSLRRFRSWPLAQGLLGMAATSFLLACGRATFGSLVDVIPGSHDVFFRRFGMGLQLPASTWPESAPSPFGVRPPGSWT